MRERMRVPRTLRAGTGHDELGDTVRGRARQHGVEIVAKRFVGQVGADVDQLHASVCGAKTRHYAKAAARLPFMHH